MLEAQVCRIWASIWFGIFTVAHAKSSEPSSDPLTLLIESLPEELFEHYDVLGALGDGAFAKVRRGVHKLTKCKVAIKVFFLLTNFDVLKNSLFSNEHLSKMISAIFTERLIFGLAQATQMLSSCIM